MCLKSEGMEPVPEETARLAHIVSSADNLCLLMRDELGEVFQDELFASLFPRRGQPAEAPWRLAMVTVLQFAEGLTDRQAANAVRTRIDVKYALGLELEDQGFDFSVLSEYRARLVAGGAEQRLFEALLTHAKARGWLKARGRQRTDSTHVLAAIQSLSRLECVAETLRHALNVLATVDPAWLQAWVPREWFERYATRLRRLPAAQWTRRTPGASRDARQRWKTPPPVHRCGTESDLVARTARAHHLTARVDPAILRRARASPLARSQRPASIQSLDLHALRC
jgi:transposase